MASTVPSSAGAAGPPEQVVVAVDLLCERVAGDPDLGAVPGLADLARRSPTWQELIELARHEGPVAASATPEVARIGRAVTGRHLAILLGHVADALADGGFPADEVDDVLGAFAPARAVPSADAAP